MLGVSKRITPCLLQVIQEVERGEVRVKGFKRKNGIQGNAAVYQPVSLICLIRL